MPISLTYHLTLSSNLIHVSSLLPHTYLFHLIPMHASHHTFSLFTTVSLLHIHFTPTYTVCSITLSSAYMPVTTPNPFIYYLCMAMHGCITLTSCLPNTISIFHSSPVHHTHFLSTPSHHSLHIFITFQTPYLDLPITLSITPLYTHISYPPCTLISH